MAQQLKELQKEAKKQGWSITIAKAGHLKWRSPTGALVVTSQTPSDPRTIHNIVRDLQKRGFVRRKK